MDLTVSPDIEAFWSYLIVLVLGVFVAHRQVTKRLENLKDVWLVVDTWILFFAYLAVPLGLFWLLDRTGAVKDSSLFAALVVGIGYERILAGSDSSIVAPQGLSGYWSPFVSYANRVTEKIRDAARRADRRLQKRLLAEILADDARFKNLEDLAKIVSPDVAALTDELDAVDADTALGAGARRERKADILYEEVRSADDFLYELKEKELVTRRWYFWHAHQLGSKLSVVVVLLIVAFVVFYARHEVSLPRLGVDYALWRLEKPNASSPDLYRAERRLGQSLNEPKTGHYAFERIGTSLRIPEPALTRIDALLEILLSQRCAAAPASVDLPGLLVESFTTDNADVRTRIHRALVYLAEGQSSDVPAQLNDWSPSDGDSVTELQRRVTQWRDYWRGVGEPQWPECMIREAQPGG